ncbi:MAG: RsmE family RNA methyltransferase [Verrucomicrobiota bacterium]
MMHRFYCPHPDSGRLDPSESHHARSVLRVKAGDRCTVFDGRGKELQAEVTEVGKHQLCFSVVSSHQSKPLPFSIHLVQALTKGRSWSLILEKSTELGVSSISPVLSDRSVTRIGAEDTVKHEKWRQEIITACKQSGRNYLPRLSPVTRIEKLTDPSLTQYTPKFIASLQPDALPLKLALERVMESELQQDITIAVGPEGDFSPAELGQFRAMGYQPVSLGPNVLRAETAAIYLCAVLFYEMQHRFA